MRSGILKTLHALNDMYDFLTSEKYRKGDHLVFMSFALGHLNKVV